MVNSINIEQIKIIESIFDNVIIEEVGDSPYFDKGTTFIKYGYTFSLNYSELNSNLDYLHLNDPHYWNEEYRDKKNGLIISSDFKPNSTQSEISTMKLPDDIIEKINKMGLTKGEIKSMVKLCKLIYTKRINVGYDQLIRSSLILSDFRIIKLVEIIKENFMKDPRDVLVYAYKKDKELNYGIEIFK